MAFWNKIFSRQHDIVMNHFDFGSNIARLFSGGDEVHINQSNAYLLATSLAEIAFPIDLVADRVATLKYDLVNDSGGIIERPSPSVARLLNRPNALSTLPMLMYNSAFILMSDGNLVATRTRPALLSESQARPDNIISVQLRHPGSYTINWDKNADVDIIENVGEAIRSLQTGASTFGKTKIYIGNDVVLVGNGGSAAVHSGGVEFRSPLLSAARNIDNLLVVYQARYRAYTKTPMGILLSPRSAPASDIASIVNSGDRREQIINDISQRYGVTGYDFEGKEKKMWAVSSVSLQAIKTLATIAELQPFEETREDALQIAGLFNVDKELIPTHQRTALSTDNKEAAEEALYDGIITSTANDVADFVTKLICLDQVGLRLRPNLEIVPVLQARKLKRAQSDNNVIDLLLKMRSNGLAEDEDVKTIAEKIINNYKI